MAARGTVRGPVNMLLLVITRSGCRCVGMNLLPVVHCPSTRVGIVRTDADIYVKIKRVKNFRNNSSPPLILKPINQD